MYNINRVLNLIKKNNPSTYMHMARVSILNRDFGKFLKLSKEDIEVLYISGLLHDIGKIFISNHILNKKGRLSDLEFERIKQHPTLGFNFIKKINLGEYEKYRNTIENVIYTHHKGMKRSYPETDIEKDIFSDITSISDCFDALSSQRSYKEAFPYEESLEIMKKDEVYNENLLGKFSEMIEKIEQERAL